MLNPIYSLCLYMVFARIWSLPVYGLCLYMVFGSGFPANCVESYGLLGLVFLSQLCLNARLNVSIE